MEAPAGFQPQTQQNNGGPRGLGQPARSTPQAAPSRNQGQPQTPEPGPMAGTGQPPQIYGGDPRAMLWSARNSMDPQQLIIQAFAALQGRTPNPFEIQSLMQLPSTDQMLEQIFNMQQPGAPSPVQQAILR